MNPLKVKAYSKGNGGCGIYIGFPEKERFFDPRWESVEIEINGKMHSIGISYGFWRKCPELCSPVIGEWLKQQNAAEWPKRKPPKFDFIPLGGRSFRLIGK